MQRCLALLCACGLATALPGAGASPAAAVPQEAGSPGCLPGGNGYLHARIRGAMNLDVDWHNAEIECEGGPRPTVIFEGEERLFTTRGEDHCTVDELRQERLGALGGALRSWRIIARGFCTSPASTLNSEARILVSRFDFAGSAVFADQ